jgi:hypothetical protein
MLPVRNWLTARTAGHGQVNASITRSPYWADSQGVKKGYCSAAESVTCPSSSISAWNR